MAYIVFYDPDDVDIAGIVTVHHNDVDSGAFPGVTNKLVDPSLVPVAGVPKNHWKVVTGALAEMSQGEKDTVSDRNSPGGLRIAPAKKKKGNPDGNQTLEVQKEYLFDISGYTDHHALTLPTEALRGQVIRVGVSDGNATYDARVRTPAGVTVVDEDYATDASSLIVAFDNSGEHIELECIVEDTTWGVKSVRTIA